MLTQVLGPDCLSMCAFRLVKTDETLVAGLPLRYDGALPYRRMPIQLCFYFSWFDAKTPYFDLRIHPAQILNAPIGSPTGQISGLIHASARLEWVGNESFARQLWPV